MAELSVPEVEAALARHASSTGEVYPSALALVEAENHWSGRLWDVLRVVMADQATMRYVAAGNRPDEVAACAARWADSALEVEDIRAIFASGGYDPEPFEVLAAAGLLRESLQSEDGKPRIICGERAGVWISDEFALSSEPEILEGIERVLGTSSTSA